MKDDCLLSTGARDPKVWWMSEHDDRTLCLHGNHDEETGRGVPAHGGFSHLADVSDDRYFGRNQPKPDDCLREVRPLIKLNVM